MIRKNNMRMKISVWFVSVLILTVITAGALQVSEIYIKAGKMFDSEQGVFVENQIIKVIGDRIVEVSASLKIPEGARIIDLSGKSVLPGLIDAHTHLLYLENLSGESNSLSMQGLKAVLMEGDALRALRGAARAKTFLEAGITAVQDLGNSGRFADIALRTAIDEGSAEGPRLRVSGPGLSAAGGQFPGLLHEHQSLVDYEYRVIRSVEDGIQAVRENVNMGVDLIKLYADNVPNRALLSVKEMAAVVEEAHRYGLRVTAHAVSDPSIRNAALAGVDGIDHVYSVSDGTLNLIKEKGITVIPTYTDKDSFVKFMTLTGRVSQEQAEKSWEYSKKSFVQNISRFMKLGIPVASGSDMYINMHTPQGKAAKRVLFSYFECGMPPLEILKTTTVNAAAHLGMKGRIGVIKPRAYADIIAVDGDPEKDIYSLKEVSFVMKGGIVYVGGR